VVFCCMRISPTITKVPLVQVKHYFIYCNSRIHKLFSFIALHCTSFYVVIDGERLTLNRPRIYNQSRLRFLLWRHKAKDIHAQSKAVMWKLPRSALHCSAQYKSMCGISFTCASFCWTQITFVDLIIVWNVISWLWYFHCSKTYQTSL